MSTEYRIRLANISDAAVIARQRAAMFHDMGRVSADDAERLRAASEPWLARLLATDEYVGWLVEHESVPVAGGGISLSVSGPLPECLREGRWAYIQNIYTDPAHRRRGLARKLMQAILQWCKRNAIDHVSLRASDEGKPLYAALGFQPTAEMKLPMQWRDAHGARD